MAPPTTSPARAGRATRPHGRPSTWLCRMGRSHRAARAARPEPVSRHSGAVRAPFPTPQESLMKIKSVRARVYEWTGKTVPPQGNFAQRHGPCWFAAGNHEHLPLPRLDRGRDRDRRRHRGLATWRWRRASPRPSSTSTGAAGHRPRPLDYEYLWQRMYRATHAWGRKGVAMAAISAVDLAIWDILGVRGQAGVRCWAGAPRRRFLLLLQALSRRSRRHAARGADLF